MRRPQYIASILLLSVSVACGGGMAVSRTVDDATITTRVKTSLLNEPGVAAQRISVQTTGGVVTLSGVVKSADEEQHAISAARKVEGVRDVKSDLKIQQQLEAGGWELEAGRLHARGVVAAVHEQDLSRDGAARVAHQEDRGARDL